eukprot:1675259-Pleurochrysis_carterae.AAC.2
MAVSTHIVEAMPKQDSVDIERCKPKATGRGAALECAERHYDDSQKKLAAASTSVSKAHKQLVNAPDLFACAIARLPRVEMELAQAKTNEKLKLEA